MTKSLNLLGSLKQVAAELKKAAVWNGTGLAVDAERDDYLYELLCFFRAAIAAQAHYQLRVTGATARTRAGKLAAKWPKKPGNKQNFSFISIVDPRKEAREHFQLCPGVKVVDIHGKDRAPDITLQLANAPAQPTSAHLLGVWDAKYTATVGARLSDVAIADFAYTFAQLGRPTLPPTWSSVVCGNEWKRSGVLTNGRPSTEPNMALVNSGISETCQYPSGATSTRP